jgi:hypothetical protein
MKVLVGGVSVMYSEKSAQTVYGLELSYTDDGRPVNDTRAPVEGKDSEVGVEVVWADEMTTPEPVRMFPEPETYSPLSPSNAGMPPLAVRVWKELV